uniref:Uncharacterized protein n=1 Tax=Arundo donax TaxID=35708 RepID=A0A0A9E274_ARUDO
MEKKVPVFEKKMPSIPCSMRLAPNRVVVTIFKPFSSRGFKLLSTSTTRGHHVLLLYFLISLYMVFVQLLHCC